MTTEKNKKIITSTLGVILASASIMFVYTQNDKPTDSKPVAIVDKEVILEKHEQLNFPLDVTLEIKEKETEKKVAEANKIREEARDKAHAEKLAKEKAEREEAEKQRQLALQKEEEEKRRKHEQETKNYAVVSRGENVQQVAQQAQEYKQQQQQQIQSQQSQGTNLGTFQVTGYGADCVGCSGITAAGINVSGGITHYQGYRVIATDPNVIPMFSIVHIEGVGNCIAVDTGGAIKGNIIDLLFPSEAHTHSWGRQHLNVSIVRYGA